MHRLSTALKWAGSYSRFKSLKLQQYRSVSVSSILQYKWEPDDLKMEPDIPEYETLNIKMKGYDFPVLESFAKYVHRIASNLDAECTKFAVPAKKLEIHTLQFQSVIVKDSCKLNLYERVVQVQSLPSPTLPILLEMITGNTPEGVNITVAKNTPEDDEFLYIPDHQKHKIEQMMEELEQRRA